jgi:hypothetical protein
MRGSRPPIPASWIRIHRCGADAGAPRGAFLAYVDFGTGNANLCRLMSSSDARSAGDPRLIDHAHAAFEILLELIRQGQATGWLAARDPVAQAVACWTQLHGLTLLTADGLLAKQRPPGDAARVAITELLIGLEAACA